MSIKNYFKNKKLEQTVTSLGQGNDQAMLLVRKVLDLGDADFYISTLEDCEIYGEKLNVLYNLCGENFTTMLYTIQEFFDGAGIFSKELITKNFDSENPVPFIDQAIYNKYLAIEGQPHYLFTNEDYAEEILTSFNNRFKQANNSNNSSSQPGEE